MNKENILEMFDYNYWANARIVNAALSTTQAEFDAPASFPFGGLRGTFLHILDAEYGWRNFLQNNNWDLPDLNEADFPTMLSMQEKFKSEETAMRAHLATLTDKDMDVHRTYKIPSGVIRDRIQWHCLYHLVNHGTQHRAEAAAILSSLNHSPGDIDFTVFMNEKAGK